MTFSFSSLNISTRITVAAITAAFRALEHVRGSARWIVMKSPYTQVQLPRHRGLSREVSIHSVDSYAGRGCLLSA
jgi:hypothetical protein